ncbi:citrate synthase/methylcitrate synthase [Chelativorans sp. AA-79]|uniref:citrate synthase/methylcitrate synthase n=1 Tax=Chelativorans sp. AA-79 TaxID=3028735 RepID=UPI0023F79764|nr:citrate synthase/methylcitrate synthase [Chelativorans sp. AA-79]WEX08745.1 citrate synthase/methylcitrate synthase [Chelativorans sp. AA-79]
MSVGLDDVIAAETVLSHVDGEAGRLIVRGHDVEELAGRRSYEAVAALLWSGFAEEDGEAAVRSALGAARVAAFPVAERLLPFSDGLAPVEALRLMLGALPDASEVPAHILVTAAMPVFVAAIARDRQGASPVAPDAGLGQAEDFLRMLRGAAVPPEHVKAMETYLVTVVDHGLNASTFAARVVAATRAGMVSSVVAALCALKGPLHGGAPGPVLDMLDDIGAERNIEPWLTDALDRGERLMGFGHRVYRVRDPRADVLKAVANGLRGGENRIRFAEEVEAGALDILARRKASRPLKTNVEFYTALVLEALELPRETFTPVFAIGRVAGWAAHVLEQESTGRLIRPQSRYVGPVPRRAA